MPKRTDIKKILLIGSGPIVIGQACEFDYSGTQACKALREEGYTVVLVNSNPATIMTDPTMADATYVEPLIPEILEKIIEKERPDAILPTLGGQTALNLAKALYELGVLQKYNVKMIGADYEAIQRAEDRLEFKQAMEEIGLDMPKSAYVKSIDEAIAFTKLVPYPFISRPSFTLGGIGGGVANNEEELRELIAKGLEYSPVHTVLLEESIMGWKEYELEVMRDKADNFVVICSIENLDPMGVHTGDSITVAPAQTLTDVEYQNMREAAKKIIRKIGVETGGSNIQFAVNPANGRMIIIEMNPRVSRSSALASKATGFPIAKIAAKLAVGYTLDELPNDITRTTPASFEPTIDYVVTKIPRFAFEKFPDVDQQLNTAMKSVGEVMAIGRTFKESLHKAVRSLERKLPAFSQDLAEIKKQIGLATQDRLFYLFQGFRKGLSVEEIHAISKVDPWFLDQIKQMVEMETDIQKNFPTPSLLLRAKQFGFNDKHLGKLWNKTEEEIRALRHKQGIKPQFKLVDTCAAEFPSYTPYYYSTYENPVFQLKDDGSAEQILQAKPKTTRKSVVILGSGPNRIGQGIEFDYCCVHASYTLRDTGFDSIMVNCNPETVSTDYDTSSRLYFEPITVEDVLAIYEHEKPEGVIVQFGGQTPINIAAELEKNGVKILGTSISSIDLAEDREQFASLLNDLGIPKPDFGTASSDSEAKKLAETISYPVIVRPSYVLGGRAMEIVYSEEGLTRYLKEHTQEIADAKIIFIDKFLQEAQEIDVDALCDGENVYIAGIMEHIEEAGIHSGDSACVLPPTTIAPQIIERVKEYTVKLGKALQVKGCMNIQMAVKDDVLYVLEVNPRASRTVPFVSKATGIPLITFATKIIMGVKLSELGLKGSYTPPKYKSVKEVVLPFVKFSGSDTVLGPEMKSTGEVMGIGETFAEAFAKAELAASVEFPTSGKVFISVSDEGKQAMMKVAQRLSTMGYDLVATENTANFLKGKGITVGTVAKVSEDKHPNIVDLIKEKQIALIINTPSSHVPASRSDGYKIRTNAVRYNIPIFTTIPAIYAMLDALEVLKNHELRVKPLQEYY
ncbi:MAG: carbamoyl-phosphate synthase large subunit [bacterium]